MAAPRDRMLVPCLLGYTQEFEPHTPIRETAVIVNVSHCQAHRLSAEVALVGTDAKIALANQTRVVEQLAGVLFRLRDEQDVVVGDPVFRHVSSRLGEVSLTGGSVHTLEIRQVVAAGCFDARKTGVAVLGAIRKIRRGSRLPLLR